ncbi:hypothetical protein G9A89_011987 [Geosiphon pyriformis]|nr:hypothetical protein G9A89_011987 [Geosiphon pyriformis]
MAVSTRITDACQVKEKIWKMKDGNESPIWWRILDLRPMTNRLGPANKRAKEFITKETLKIVQIDQMNLKEFLKDNVKIEMVRMDKFDLESGGGLSITNEKMEKLSQHADIIALASCYTVLELWYPSHYYGGADSGYPYIQITLRYTANKQSRPDSLVVAKRKVEHRERGREHIKHDIESSQKVCGDHFDWLFAVASAVESVRLFIRIRNIMNYSANLIQVLIKEAKEVRDNVSHISSVDNEIATIQDFGTPVKPKTKPKLKIKK